MIRYLETKIAGIPYLIKLDTIRDVLGHSDGTCSVNGQRIGLSFEGMKRILEADDHRQVVDYENWPPALLYLARNRVCDAIKELGPEGTLEYLRDVVLCDSLSACNETWRAALRKAGKEQP